jgi:hypothetical protein
MVIFETLFLPEVDPYGICLALASCLDVVKQVGFSAGFVTDKRHCVI